MKGIHSALALIAVVCLPYQAEGFARASYGGQTSKRIKLPSNTAVVAPSEIAYSGDKLLIAKATNDESNEVNSDESGFFSGIKINAPYALAYVLFLGYAFLRQSGEAEGASMEVLNQYMADPSNPGFNELFVSIFNLLGLYAAPIACLLLPGAKGQKLPATPFVLGSMFGGYGVLGLYTSTLTSNPSPVSKADLGWFTSNVLENKLFNYFIVLATASAYVTSGALAAFISDPVSLVQGYGEMFSETALVSASSLDLVILTLSAASFIPDDLSRRGYKGDLSPELIAASSALLPGLGVALYCALRPSLDEE